MFCNWLLRMLCLVKSQDVLNGTEIYHVTTRPLDGGFSPYSKGQQFHKWNGEKRLKMLCFSTGSIDESLRHLRTNDMRAHVNRLGNPDEFPIFVYQTTIPLNSYIADIKVSGFGPEGYLRTLYFMRLWVLSFFRVHFAVDVIDLKDSMYGRVITPLRPEKLNLTLVAHYIAEPDGPYYRIRQLTD